MERRQEPDRTSPFKNVRGEDIHFMHDGTQWWIALKPIIESLGLKWDHNRERIHRDIFFGPQQALMRMTAADNKQRMMLSLPERYIYGWLFTLRTRSPLFHDARANIYNELINLFRSDSGEMRKPPPIQEKP